MIPEFLDEPGVLGIGEIGLNKNTRTNRSCSWSTSTWRQRPNEQILIHTPHLEDKYQGTRMILDMLCRRSPLRPQPRAGRSRRRAHGSPRARRRLLGRHDALPGEQMHARAGRRHGRDVRPRAAAGEFGRRLGPVEADGRARLHPGDALRGHSEAESFARSCTKTRWSSSARAVALHLGHKMHQVPTEPWPIKMARNKHARVVRRTNMSPSASIKLGGAIE